MAGKKIQLRSKVISVSVSPTEGGVAFVIVNIHKGGFII